MNKFRFIILSTCCLLSLTIQAQKIKIKTGIEVLKEQNLLLSKKEPFLKIPRHVETDGNEAFLKYIPFWVNSTYKGRG